MGADLSIFGRTFLCECGKTHKVEPREVLYADGAASRMPEICSRATQGRRAAVLMDTRTAAVAGRDVFRALSGSGWSATELVVPDPTPGHSPICDDLTKETLAARMGETDLIVPVGGGVVTDLARWLALDRKLPFVSFGTAASMNGYASANIAGTVRGVKSLIYARPPLAVAADPEIIRDAPYELTASGLGDILAKPISTADWRLNQFLFGDYYCAKAVGLVADIEHLYMDRPERIKAREPEALDALFSGLLLTGVSMTMAGTSAPASGGEHMISHTLDMMSSLDGTEHDLHGRQVGLGTIVAAELYRRVLEIESPVFAPPGGDIDRPFWGRLADATAAEYAGKVARLRSAAETLRRSGRWDDMRRTLSPMVRSPGKLRDCLSHAGAAHKAEHVKTTRQRILKALLHAHEIRPRVTILDLAMLVGVMPGAAAEIVAEWC